MSKLIGCDLEYAFRHSSGNILPAGLLPINGRKGHPEMIETGGVEIDCCAVELTMPPADSEDVFVNNILRHLNAVKERYKSFGSIETIASHKFDDVHLKTIRYANEMGCDPDFNVWTKKRNPRPRSNNGLRTFGGHVHISEGTPYTIMACDLTLGMWSVVKDRDAERRKLYGKAGAFRKKSYGVEYRVLSNFWCDDEKNIRRVFQLVEAARSLESEIDMYVRASGGPNNIQDVINNSRVMDAKHILKGLGINYAA